MGRSENLQEEQDRFAKCMKHMNSMYCYCDVVLFVQASLPGLDDTIYDCVLVPSEHKWLNFIDTIQYLGGGEEKSSIQNNDIVIKMKDTDASLTVDLLKNFKRTTVFFFADRTYEMTNIPYE